MTHTDNQLQEGAILYGVYGYSMTIPHFYVVTRVTPKGCKVMELNKRMVRSTDGGYNQQGYEMPCLPVRPGANEWQARYKGNGEWKIGTCFFVRRWLGEPVYANYCD